MVPGADKVMAATHADPGDQRQPEPYKAAPNVWPCVYPNEWEAPWPLANVCKRRFAQSPPRWPYALCHKA